VAVDPDQHGTPLASTLSLMTWNVWWRFGPWAERQPVIETTLGRVGADVVCLQEAWTETGGGQVPKLADALGYEFVFGEGLVGGDGAAFGLAVLSRWPILASETRTLPAIEGKDELRIAMHARIDGPRGPIDVYTTHLNWRFDHSAIRQDQVRAICDWIASGAAGRSYPPILCGDFNADPRADEIKMLTGRAAVPVDELVFQDVWDVAGDGPGNTWDNANPHAAADLEPTRRIDYVFVGWPWGDRGAGSPVSARVEGREPVDGVVGSDHYAVVADLRY
jgi:endonuclease/exonuclease/phosphatase family metal-dependent hydrolase